jgi:hypothetical protein
MLFVRLNFPALCRLFAVALLGALAGYALRGPEGSAAPRPVDTIASLVAHLEQRGIHLRVVADSHGGDIRAGAYLTRTNQNWEQLSVWVRIPQQLPHWRGTLHVKPQRSLLDRAEALANWKECCLVYGQLVLFGDPDLLAEVRAAVQE